MTDQVPPFYDHRDSDIERRENEEWMFQGNASRDAKWWYSAFHNVTAIVGAGVLGLSNALSKLGWGPGISIMVVSWLVTLFTLWQMVEMHEMVPGKRFDRYHELGQHAFGRKLGLYIVVPQQVLVQLSVCIVYMVTGGTSLSTFHELVCHNCKDIPLTYFIMIFASVHFVISHLPNFNSISGVSLIAAIMSVSYCTIAWTACAFGDQDVTERSFEIKTDVFGFFGAFGTAAFAYAGHNVVLEIQATIPSTPEKPSKGPMWKGVVVSYMIVAFCYFPVALLGYRTFGDEVSDNLLLSLKTPTWLIAAANMFVVVHMIGGYQVYAMPVFDMMETVLVRKFHFRYSKTRSIILRSIYVGFTMIVAIVIPFFGALLSFFGGFIFAPTSYFLPCVMWLILKENRRFSLSWWANWICICYGVTLTIVAPIGGFKQILHEAKYYQFWKSVNQTNGN